MEVLTRYGIRASAALNSEVCDHHPEIIEEADRLGWELIGHNQTNALRLTEMDEAEERDEVTLWHLLTRVGTSDRDRVFDRLAQFVPPPQGVTREGIRAGRREMLDAWWDALGLGTAAWWRTWKR